MLLCRLFMSIFSSYNNCFIALAKFDIFFFSIEFFVNFAVYRDFRNAFFLRMPKAYKNILWAGFKIWSYHGLNISFVNKRANIVTDRSKLCVRIVNLYLHPIFHPLICNKGGKPKVIIPFHDKHRSTLRQEPAGFMSLI